MNYGQFEKFADLAGLLDPQFTIASQYQSFALCNDTASGFTDSSGSGGDILVDKANTGAFGTAGYMSSIAGTYAGCTLPFTWNPATESLILSFTLKKAAPASNQNLVGVCASISAPYTGIYLSHRTSGALKIVPVIAGVVTNAQNDSSLSFSDGTPQNRQVTLQWDAPTGSFYLWRDEVLSDAFPYTMVGANAFPNASLTKNIHFGGLCDPADASVAALFNNVHVLKFTGSLPVTAARIARLLAKNPSIALKQSDIVFPNIKTLNAILGQSNEAGAGGGSPAFISANMGDGAPCRDPLKNGASGTAGYNSPWPKVAAAAGRRGVWAEYINTAYGSTNLTDVWVGKLRAYSAGMIVMAGSYVLDANGRVYKANGTLGTAYALNVTPSSGVGTSGLTSWTDTGVAAAFEVDSYIYKYNDGTGKFDPNGRMALLLSALSGKPGYDKKAVHIYIGQGDKTTSTTAAQFSSALQSASAYLTSQGIHVFIGMTITAASVDAWYQAQLLPGRSTALAALASNPLVHAGYDAATGIGVLPQESTAQPAAMEVYPALQNNAGSYLHGNAVVMTKYAAGIDAANALSGF